jgi:sugar (pentulose or hexulose) kinase
LAISLSTYFRVEGPTRSRGVLSGLTLKHGRAHVFRSILEGVAFGTHLILQTMRANGFAPAEVRPVWAGVRERSSCLSGVGMKRPSFLVVLNAFAI